MPGAPTSKPALYADDDDRPPSADQHTDRESDTPKPAKKSDAKSKDEAMKGEARGKGGGGGGGWLGGILNKLALRAPNQMILPDDKNPTIVWDADKKRWRNLDQSDDEAAHQPPPPPPPAHHHHHHHLQHQHQHQHHLATAAPAAGNRTDGSASPPLQGAGAGAGAAGAPPPVTNIFKMQKARHIKKSYVDVFNPSGAATRPLPPAAEVLGPPAAHHVAPAYFTPTHPQSGVYDASQLAATEDDQYHSGI